MPSSPFETTVYPPIPNLRIAKSFLARLRTKFEAESATLALTAVALTADALNQGDFLVKQCEFMESKVDHLVSSRALQLHITQGLQIFADNRMY